MTATAERIKLENPGDELTLTVTSVSPEDIGGYAYWKISDGVKEFVAPAKSINPQVERLGVTSALEMVGKTVRFSRSTKLSSHGRPYWNVDGARAPNNTSPKPAVMASKPNAELPPLLQNQEEEDAAELASKVGVDLGKFSKDLALYTALTEFVTKDIAPIHVKGGIGMSPESAVAAVATLYIQAKHPLGCACLSDQSREETPTSFLYQKVRNPASTTQTYE